MLKFLYFHLSGSGFHLLPSQRDQGSQCKEFWYGCIKEGILLPDGRSNRNSFSLWCCWSRQYLCWEVINQLLVWYSHAMVNNGFILLLTYNTRLIVLPMSIDVLHIIHTSQTYWKIFETYFLACAFSNIFNMFCNPVTFNCGRPKGQMQPKKAEEHCRLCIAF